ncbi:unnamed protein product [Vicia faba]|uniref:Uncharacterized protein n=1 Tax=Vicia faba TaxID=3906 RepID=A0AAV1ATZ3_VICFA|nr:unnamed protein product [Vicia faba]
MHYCTIHTTCKHSGFNIEEREYLKQQTSLSDSSYCYFFKLSISNSFNPVSPQLHGHFLHQSNSDPVQFFEFQVVGLKGYDPFSTSFLGHEGAARGAIRNRTAGESFTLSREHV